MICRILLSLIISFSGLQHIFASDAIKQNIDSVNALPYDFIVSNARQAIDIFSKNRENASSINYKFGEAKALDQLHTAYSIYGKLEKRTEAVLEAIKIYEEINDLPNLINLYGRYGYQQRKRDFESAKKYMRRGIYLAEKNQFKNNLTSLYDDYGILHEESNNLDSAMFYYQRAFKVKPEVHDTIGIPYSLNNIAGVYTMKGDFKKALDYAARSDVYRNKEKGDFGRAMNLVLYGEIYIAMGEPDSALSYFNRCLNKSLFLGYKDLTRYSYQRLTLIYVQKNNYKQALENQSKAIAYKDSLLNIETNRTISELEIAYETEKKDLEITEQELAIRHKTTQLIVAISIIGALLSLALYIYRIQSLKRERLRKELELRNQLKQAELEKKMSDEKLRISRELHDNIGSHLTFMISSMDNLSYMAKEEKVLFKIKRMGSYGRKTLNELRHSIWAMKHEDSEVSELILKINELKQQLQDEPSIPDIEVINQISDVLHLSSVQMLNLFRIVQEALQNTIKYAEASRVQILFTKQDSTLHLNISDDGNGFDLETANKGNGLRNMKHRCEESGGSLEIQSSDLGTKVICSIQISN